MRDGFSPVLSSSPSPIRTRDNSIVPSVLIDRDGCGLEEIKRCRERFARTPPRRDKRGKDAPDMAVRLAGYLPS